MVIATASAPNKKVKNRICCWWNDGFRFSKWMERWDLGPGRFWDGDDDALL